MENFQFLLEKPSWWLIFCLIAAGLYAFLLYQKEGIWSARTNKTLAGLRFLLVFLISLLLLGPLLRLVQNTIERPNWVFLIDDSSSIAETEDSLRRNQMITQIVGASEQLKDQEFDAQIRTLSGQESELSNLRFNGTSTDLRKAIKQIESDFEGRNLAGVTLVTDGIVSQGNSPEFDSYPFEIVTVGLGDTIPKNDIKLNAVYFNKVAYQGNQFPLIAEIVQDGFDGGTVQVSVLKQGKLVQTQNVKLAASPSISEVRFNLDAEQQGLQQYSVRVIALEGEHKTNNNSQEVFIDVIEGKKRILIYAAGPHPDIKALRAAIEGNQNYEVEVFYPALSNGAVSPAQEYDLCIFHQIPERRGTNRRALKTFIDSEIPLWFIYGAQGNLNFFNAINETVKFAQSTNQVDMVGPVYNKSFSKFTFEEELLSEISAYVPVQVPFSEVELVGNTEVLLYQKVGSITTDRPLLAIKEQDGKKRAVSVGSNLWKWRIQEYANTESHKAFDQLIQKLVQYLASKEDKQKFKVYPTKQEFINSESVTFVTEVYNSIYEPIFGQEVKLKITSEKGETQELTYTNSENTKNYKVNGLPEGAYRFTASTSLEGNALTSTGQFSVRQLQLEQLNTTANHRLLRKISNESGGQFFKGDQIEEALSYVKSKEAVALIYSSENFLPVIHLFWVFLLILVLVSIEWFIRKYQGGY